LNAVKKLSASESLFAHSLSQHTKTFSRYTIPCLRAKTHPPTHVQGVIQLFYSHSVGSLPQFVTVLPSRFQEGLWTALAIIVYRLDAVTDAKPTVKRYVL